MFPWWNSEQCFQVRSRWHLWFNRGGIIKEDRKLSGVGSDWVSSAAMDISSFGWFWGDSSLSTMHHSVSDLTHFWVQVCGDNCREDVEHFSHGWSWSWANVGC